MGYFAARGGFERDIDGTGPSADAGVIRAPEGGFIRVKMESINLCAERSGRRKTRLSISTVEIASSDNVEDDHVKMRYAHHTMPGRPTHQARSQ